MPDNGETNPTNWQALREDRWDAAFHAAGLTQFQCIVYRFSLQGLRPHEIAESWVKPLSAFLSRKDRELRTRLISKLTTDCRNALESAEEKLARHYPEARGAGMVFLQQVLEAHRNRGSDWCKLHPKIRFETVSDPLAHAEPVGIPDLKFPTPPEYLREFFRNLTTDEEMEASSRQG